MKNQILITGGRVINPANKMDKIADVLIKNGKIAKIVSRLKMTDSGCQIINAKGKVVTPGLFDMHVHLREPGREDKETIKTAMRAAIKGGVTSILSMPNTNPEANNQTVIEFQIKRAKELNLINLYPSGKITRNGTLSEMWEMKNSGAVAMTDDGNDVQNEDLLKHAFEWAKTFDLPILTHAEIESLTHDGVMHEGKISFKLGLKGIPRSAEDLAVLKSLFLAEEVNARIHISHVSSANSVEAIRQAKKRGVKATAEATPHHFALTHKECVAWNTNAKMMPPLREEKDVQAVIKGLKDGTIDAIATDHAPHLVSEKMLPFADAPNGTVGLETLFGCVNTYLVRTKKLTLIQAIAKMTINPAKVLNLKNVANLKIGMPADIAIFDLNKKWTVDPNKFESKGKNSAFTGKVLYGMATEVIVGGEVKMRNRKIV